MILPSPTPLDIALAIHGDKENIPISVDPADEGEVLAEEVREITDDEVVEILEGIDDMNEDAQLRLQVNKNADELQKLSGELADVKSRLFDNSGGAKGYMTRTEEQFTAIQEKIDNQGREQKDDLHEGISTIHAMIKSFEETILFSLGEQNKKIETLDTRVDDHEGRIKVIEKKHEKEEKTAEIVKKAAVGTAVTTGLGGAIAGIRAFLSFGGGQ